MGAEPPGTREGMGAVAAAVLAGGSSRRMGRDKATLRVGGTELARAAIRAAAAVAEPVVLVAPDGHPAATLAGRAGVGWVPDPGEGPLAALAAALRATRAPHLLVLAADHPDLRPELLALLVAERGQAGAGQDRGPRGVPGAVAQPRDHLVQARGDRPALVGDHARDARHQTATTSASTPTRPSSARTSSR
jgi:CTP:molybdopterin cytidylyltransferase MocA